MIKLKDDSDIMIAVVIAGRTRSVVDSVSPIKDFTGIRSVERCQQVHQRALSAAASSDERGDQSLLDVQINALPATCAVALTRMDE